MKKGSNCNFWRKPIEILRAHIWWLAPVIIFVAVILLDMYCKTHWLVNLDKHTINTPIFVLFVTLLGLIGYSARQKQKLIAEQIAKARIDWLKEMREYVAEYIASVNAAYNYGMDHPEVFEVKKGINDEVKKEYIELKQKVEKNYALIMFHLNPEEKITQKLNDYLQVANNPIVKSEKMKYESELGKAVQTFFHREWAKTKREVETGRISRAFKKTK